MTELIWLNGDVMPLSEARIGVEDRGFQFADGVYEVIRVYNGRCFEVRQHLERLSRSADGITLRIPISLPSLASAIDDLIARSALADGIVYLQLTRGQSRRNHAFPHCEPTLLFHTRAWPAAPPPGAAAGLSLISLPDERWQRCWIKSIALLPNVLAKNQAVERGADEAVFIHSDTVTECSASNILFVIDGRLVTHPVGPKVLAGITRQVLIELALSLGISVEERPASLDEAMSAQEVFITSTTREIGWVRSWDGRPVQPGACGPVALRLHQALCRRIHHETGATIH